MKFPGIIDGVVVAVIIAVGAGIATLALGGYSTLGELLKLVLPWATLVYLVYLFKRSDARIGRVVAIAAWGVVSLACWLFDLHLSQQALAQAGIVWLVRSLYFHNSMLAALLDLGLIGSGLLAGAWALINTGSAAAALWSFFLLQALFCWIPAFVPRRVEDRFDSGENASFRSAHRVAIDAVRKLSQP